MKTCPVCNGTCEVTKPLEGIGTITVPCEACCRTCRGTGEVDDSAGGVGPMAFAKSPCPDCGGTGGIQPDCTHADRTPGFMAGTFYCNTCPAKIVVRADGTEEVRNEQA